MHDFTQKVACPLFMFLTAHAASLADSLYEQGHFDLARIEYMREFFFDPALKNDQHKRLQYALAVCQVDPHDGRQELRLLQNDFDSLGPDIATALARQYITMEDYADAWALLIQTDDRMLAGYALVMDSRLKSARALFITMGRDDIAKDISDFQHLPRKSPRTAGILSALCPGAGEIYAGNVQQGIKGFLLTAASGFLMYHTIKKEKYVDALLLFNFLFQRFYLGSIYNAQRAATAANLRQRQNWLDTMEHTCFSSP